MKSISCVSTAPAAAAALLAGCGSIGSKDGGYYTTEAPRRKGRLRYRRRRDGQQPDARTPPMPPTRPPRKSFITPTVNMESTDFDAARETLMAAVEANGAWMESVSVYGDAKDHDRSADYTVRVPVENYRTFLAAVGEAGRAGPQRDRREHHQQLH